MNTAARQAETIPADSGVVRRSESAPESFILMVDDNEDDVFLGRRALRRARVGSPVVVVNDGLEALDLIWSRIRAGASLPSVILLDLDLPRQSGMDVLQLLRAAPSTASLPVIVLTGCNHGGSSFRVNDFKCAAFLRKPITSESFERVLGELNVLDVLDRQKLVG